MKTGGKFITSTWLAAAVGTKKLVYLIIQSSFFIALEMRNILKGQIFPNSLSHLQHYPSKSYLKADIDILDLDVFITGKHFKIISHIFV